MAQKGNGAAAIAMVLSCLMIISLFANAARVPSSPFPVTQSNPQAHTKEIVYYPQGN